MSEYLHNNIKLKKYVYANIDENKDENKTAKEHLRFALQGTIMNLPITIGQMPGNFTI